LVMEEGRELLGEPFAMSLFFPPKMMKIQTCLHLKRGH